MSDPTWSTLYSGQQTQVSPVLDENGNPMLDDAGNIITQVVDIQDYATTQGQVIELDEGGKALLSMVRDDLKPEAAIMLRNQLAPIRAMLGLEMYTQWCAAMKNAAQLWLSGNKDVAKTQLQACGLPPELIEQWG